MSVSERINRHKESCNAKLFVSKALNFDFKDFNAKNRYNGSFTYTETGAGSDPSPGGFPYGYSYIM